MGLCLDLGAVLEGHPDVFFAVNGDVVHHRQPVCFPELRQRLPVPQLNQIGFDLVLSCHALGNQVGDLGVSGLGLIEPRHQTVVPFLVFGLIEGYVSVFFDALLDEFVLRNGEGADVGASGLVDGHADCVDVVDAVEQLQRTEGVQFHLRVVVSLDQNASAVLVVHDVQRPVCNDDAVAGAKALFDILGVVEPLFDQDHRVSAGLLGLLDQLHYEGHIPVGTFLHFGVVPSEVFGRVFCFHTECLPELVLTEGVGVGTLGCEIAAFVVVAFTEPCSLPGQLRRACWHRTSGGVHGSER